MNENDLPGIFDDEFDDDFEDGLGGDGGLFAMLYPTGGNPIYLPIDNEDDPPILSDAINEAGVSAGGSTQYWVEGVQVNPLEHRIAPNMSITAVGNVKGG